MGKRTLNIELAAAIKTAIFGGATQTDTALQFGVSQASVSNITRGKLFPDAPWPDGTAGALPTAVLKPGYNVKLKEQPEAALRFDTYPTFLQDKMLARVNEEREKIGLIPIPEVTRETQALQRAVMLTQEEGDELEMRARVAEIARKAQIMLSFERIRDADEQERREIALRELVRDRRTDEERAADLEIEIAAARQREEQDKIPPTYEAMPWPVVLRTAPASVRVREVLNSSDKVRKEALCMTFLHFPSAMWDSPAALKCIVNCELILRKYPSLIEKIEPLPSPPAPAPRPATQARKEGRHSPPTPKAKAKEPRESGAANITTK